MVFDIMPKRCTFNYSTILSGYVQWEKWSDPCAECLVDFMLCGLVNTGRMDGVGEWFPAIPESNVVFWNPMVVGLFSNEELKKAIVAGYVEHAGMEDIRVVTCVGVQQCSS